MGLVQTRRPKEFLNINNFSELAYAVKVGVRLKTRGPRTRTGVYAPTWVIMAYHANVSIKKAKLAYRDRAELKVLKAWLALLNKGPQL